MIDRRCAPGPDPPRGAGPGPEAKLVAGLERVGQALRLALRSAARREGLSPTQAQLLLRLEREVQGRRRVGPLAAQFDLTQPTVSDAVSVLERKALVERLTAPEDRRARTLRPTARGRAAARRLADWDAGARRALARLPAARREQALGLVLEMIGELQRQGLVSVARMCTTCRHYRPQAKRGAGAPARCALLDMQLAPRDLRIDCPEHEPAAA